MNHIIITEETRLRAIIQEEVTKAMPEATPLKNEIDTTTLEGALNFLKAQGYPMSKAKMYKLTSTEDIPCRKFGQKLVFSKKDLLHWAENQTKAKDNKLEAINALAKSAKRKMRY